MKYLVMCEGTNERELIRILLEHKCLFFDENDLLGLTPYHARQIKNSTIVKAELNMYTGNVEVIRVGDKQSDELLIPKEYQEKITSVKKYCTKPELEILLIISEGMLKEFEKVKSNTKAKDFAKKYIQYKHKKYNNSSLFYREYYGDRVELLIKSIISYSRYNGSHNKDEHYLKELLKDTYLL